MRPVSAQSAFVVRQRFGFSRSRKECSSNVRLLAQTLADSSPELTKRTGEILPSGKTVEYDSPAATVRPNRALSSAAQLAPSTLPVKEFPG